MKRLFALGITIIALTVHAGLLPAQGTPEPDAAVTRETVEKLIEEQEREYILVDVRTPAEYESGYIPTAVNIPLSEIGNNPPTEDKDALVILYCRSGNRSGQALKILVGLGYTNVHNIGGIIDWTGEVVSGE